METKTKKCTKCGEIKSIDEFYKRKNGGKIYSYCKICERLRMKEINNKKRELEKIENRIDVFLKDAKATYFENNGITILLKGSKTSLNPVPSCSTSIVELRKKLVNEGYLVKCKDHYKMIKDYSFSSPSAAGGVVKMACTNGQAEWKTKDGKSIGKSNTIKSRNSVDNKYLVKRFEMNMEDAIESLNKFDNTDIIFKAKEYIELLKTTIKKMETENV